MYVVSSSADGDRTAPVSPQTERGRQCPAQCPRHARVGPAAAQALQTTLLVIFVLLPLLVPLWALFSFVVVPIAARGLRNTDSRFDRASVVLSQGSVRTAVGDHAGRPGAALLASQL